MSVQPIIGAQGEPAVLRGETTAGPSAYHHKIHAGNEVVAARSVSPGRGSSIRGLSDGPPLGAARGLHAALFCSPSWWAVRRSRGRFVDGLQDATEVLGGDER